MPALDPVAPGSAVAAATPGTAAPSVDTTPLPGVDVSRLADDKKALFYTLVSSLDSPCGKAQSLRASFTTDASCKRAPFAIR